MAEATGKFKEGDAEAIEEVQDARKFKEGETEEAVSKFSLPVAIVVEGLSLGASVINSILGGLGSVNRKIVISFANNTGYPLTAISVYFQSGTSDMVLAPTIPVKSTLGFGARKTSGPVARGTVGVLTYYIQATNQTAAIMWSVPFDYNLYSNWWNFEVRSGKVAASSDLFNSLYYSSSAIKGDSNQVKRSTKGWTFEGSMADSGTPVLEVKLSK